MEVDENFERNLRRNSRNLFRQDSDDVKSTGKSVAKMGKNKIIPAKIIEQTTVNNQQQQPIVATTSDIKIVWRGINYCVDNKLILYNLSGTFTNGEVAAIMGPSGAGKSTFLNCICGRKQIGLTGDVLYDGSKKLFIGFVPQYDYLMGELTIKESLIFASQFNSINNKESEVVHSIIAENLIKRFGLESITDTKAQHCSGGQKKRLSIALEVLFKPNVLILDEPTTGLDSPSCAHVINIMLELVSDKHHPMAIVCTIHQPSVAVFNLFHRIYMLSNKGQCLYNGSPLNLLTVLSEVGLNCPEFNSPVDYLMEIASGDYGEGAKESLINKISSDKAVYPRVTRNATNIKSALVKHSHSFFRQMPIVYKRAMIILLRNPYMTVIRVLSVVFIAVFLTLLFGDKVGTASGCIPRELQVWATPFEKVLSNFQNEFTLFQANIALVFLGLFCGLISGLAPVLLYFPQEMHVFMKEYKNGWYSCLSYYFAKTISDIPLQVLVPVVYLTIVYNFTGQPLEINRPIYLLIITLLLSFLAQSMGEICSSIWMEKPNTAIFVGIMTILPMVVMGGFMVRIEKMPFLFRHMTWLSFMRYAFEALLIAIYGFSRCAYQYDVFVHTHNVSAITKPEWAEMLPMMFTMMGKEQPEGEGEGDIMSMLIGGSINGKKVTGDSSLIVIFFDLEDFVFYRAIIILSSYLIVLKIATYFIILSKLHSKK